MGLFQMLKNSFYTAFIRLILSLSVENLKQYKYVKYQSCTDPLIQRCQYQRLDLTNISYMKF